MTQTKPCLVEARIPMDTSRNSLVQVRACLFARLDSERGIRRRLRAARLCTSFRRKQTLRHVAPEPRRSLGSTGMRSLAHLAPRKQNLLPIELEYTCSTAALQLSTCVVNATTTLAFDSSFPSIISADSLGIFSVVSPHTHRPSARKKRTRSISDSACIACVCPL